MYEVYTLKLYYTVQFKSYLFSDYQLILVDDHLIAV